MTRDIRLFHRDIQLMVMSYIGTLKTLVWAPILKLFGPSVWTLRLPAVILSAATVFFFYRLLRLAGISRAPALVGTFLLATDPIFLLTNTFDWGPVALEHFLVVTACVALLEYWRTKRDGLLALGFFLLGLALWNKAIFLWAGAGLAAAAILVLWRDIRKILTRRNIAIAAAAFVLGASPFLLYNIRKSNVTLRDNAHFDSAQSALGKRLMVKVTANGNGLLGYMVEEEWNEHPKPVTSTAGRISEWIREHAGQRRETGFYYILGLCLAAVPLWWRSRAAWFGLVFCAVTWAAMAFTKDAGGSVHHTILLWPFPLLFAAAVLDRLRWRWLVAAAGILMVGMNLLVLNQYFFQFERFGPARDFTDAVFPLIEAIPTDRPVYVVDWGMFNTIFMFRNGPEMLRTGNEPFDTESMTEDQKKQAVTMIDPGDAVFVNHVPAMEVFEGVGRRLERYTSERGFAKESLQTISDTNGRPIFEVFRLKKKL